MDADDWTLRATRFGFEWGPAYVYRVMDDPRSGVVVEVTGETESVYVRVTPSGRLRVSATKKNKRDYFRSLPR